MYTGFLTSTTYTEKPYFSYPEGFDVSKLNLPEQAVFAVTK